jgi:IS5 family transposase
LEQPVQEQLTQALHSSACTTDHLITAHALGSPVEALILLQLVERSSKLQQDIEALMAAREAA